MENSTQKRNPVYDCAKGLGILFVVMGHCGALGSGFYTKFHVLFFFIFAGLMLHTDCLSNLKSLWINICKFWKRYALPYVICNSIFLCFYNFFLKYHLITNDCRYSTEITYITYNVFVAKLIKIIMLLASSEQLCGATWFLRSLFFGLFFVATLLFITSKFNKKVVYIITSIIFIVLSILIYNKLLFLFSQCILCLIIGDCLKKYITKIASNIYIYIFGGSVMILLLSIYFIKIQILLIILCAIFGFIFMIQGSLFLKEYLNRSYDFFVYLGQRTMPILCLHLLCFKIVTFLYIVITNKDISLLGTFPSIISVNHPVILSTSYTIIGVLLPVLCYRLYVIIKNKIIKIRFSI